MRKSYNRLILFGCFVHIIFEWLWNLILASELPILKTHENTHRIEDMNERTNHTNTHTYKCKVLFQYASTYFNVSSLLLIILSLFGFSSWLVNMCTMIFCGCCCCFLFSFLLCSIEQQSQHHMQMYGYFWCSFLLLIHILDTLNRCSFDSFKSFIIVFFFLIIELSDLLFIKVFG